MPDDAQDDPTVERLDPHAHPNSMMAAEHVARYRWAQQFARNRRVLDAGSGTGFGTLMLSDAGAEHVVGIDNDASAVQQSNANDHPNVEFVVGDVAAIGYSDASFDVITCMEVIEHVEDPGRVLDELRRVLKPEGLLLLSTPNKDVVVPGNRFHTHEFTPDELVEIVSARFRNVAARRQHTWLATGVMDDATLSGGRGALEQVEVSRPPTAVAGAELTTLIAASDAEIPADKIVIEICEPVELRQIDRAFHDQRNAINEQNRMIDDQRNTIDEQLQHAKSLQTELTKLRSALVGAETDLTRMAELESELEETRTLADQLSTADMRMRAAELQLRDTTLQHEQLKAVVDSLLNSTSWKVTSPLRKLMAYVRKKIA